MAVMRTMSGARDLLGEEPILTVAPAQALPPAPTYVAPYQAPPTTALVMVENPPQGKFADVMGQDPPPTVTVYQPVPTPPNYATASTINTALSPEHAPLAHYDVQAIQTPPTVIHPAPAVPPKAVAMAIVTGQKPPTAPRSTVGASLTVDTTEAERTSMIFVGIGIAAVVGYMIAKKKRWL